jgi:hypothetical protein
MQENETAAAEHHRPPVLVGNKIINGLAAGINHQLARKISA